MSLETFYVVAPGTFVAESVAPTYAAISFLERYLPPSEL